MNETIEDMIPDLKDGESCHRCGEKDDAEVMVSVGDAGFMCDTCADDMGVTRSF